MTGESFYPMIPVSQDRRRGGTYDSQQTEAVILVDASNAFNSLNRETALRNIQQLCPPLSIIIINTYREYAQLFISPA